MEVVIVIIFGRFHLDLLPEITFFSFYFDVERKGTEYFFTPSMKGSEDD